LFSQQRPGHPFLDATIPHDIASSLPEPLRPQSRGIPLAQLRVYEDFCGYMKQPKIQ